VSQQALHVAIIEAIREANLPPDQTLVVLARLLGYIVSIQDRTIYSPEAVMVAVADNMSLGGGVVLRPPDETVH
jgi:hypothetical protein